jgi:5-methylthioadenosine/S-adenosylhomocysteine deaminase
MNKELFTHHGPLLVRDVWIRGKRCDLCIDGQGRIAAVGPHAGTRALAEGTLTIEGKGRIAIPGLVNTHTHAAMTLFRGYADDMQLQPWLEQKIWPLEAHLTAEDVYWGTKLACLEMIRSGTIAFNDMYFFMDRAARAVDEMGIRAVLAYGFIDLFDEDRREREIRATEAFLGEISRLDHPRIHAALGPHAIYTVSREGFEWMADVARERHLGIHLHLSETEKEVRDSVRAHGRRPPAVLDRYGVLKPRTVAAHGCWLNRQECSLLAKRGVHVSHCPQSNMKLAVNRAMPYPLLKEYGVNVTLGTDGCASNNSLDLLETMKFATLLQKFFWNSETLLPAAEVVRLATENGAHALGIGPGRIEVGAPADVILLDRTSVCHTPLHNAESNLVYSCNGGAVHTVLCAGRVLMYNRVVPGEAGILAGAARATQRLLERAAH